MPENMGSMECLEELDASETAIRRVPSSISLLKNLKNLSFRGCKGLAQKAWDSLLCSSLLLKESSDPISLLLLNSFSGLSSLVSLDLSDCNLLDGAIPNDVGCLSSLKSLNLSGNKFTSIPDGICQVSKLRELSFRNCSRLQALPKLPSSIFVVWAQNCTSLNIYSDQIYMWSSSEGVVILSCSRLHNSEETSLRSILDNPDERPKQLLGRSLESTSYHHNVNCGPSWATEIPKWFDNQSTSSSVTMHPDSNGNEWKGCALFVIYEVHGLENSNFRISERSDSTLDLKDLHQFVYHFETNKGRLKQPLVLNSPKVPFVGPTGFWVYIPYVWFSEQSNNGRRRKEKKQSNNLDKWNYIEASITTGSPGVEVKRFGARLLYEDEDAFEFAEAIDRCSSGVFSGERSTFRKLAQFMSNLPTCVGEAECVSTCIPCPLSIEDGLRGVFHSLLLRCFEVECAKNKMYKYIFPLRASPPWFIAHRFGRSIRISLPANLYNDTRWIGFSLYACFAAHEHPTVSRDSKTCRNFSCLLSTDDGCIQSCIIFPLTRDIFHASHRLLVFHIPRVSFTHKLNQQNAIRALFGTSSSDVEAEVCGMRIVYEHQLEGFVQRVVDCILSSPDVYHQGYHRSLVDQVNSLPRNVHQAESSETLEGKMSSDFDYPSSSRRSLLSLTKLPSSVEQVAVQQHFDSPETYLVDEIARGASRDLNSNIIQDCFDRRIFNNCFPQRDIPKGFCCHYGPLLTFRLCPNLYNNSDWTGIAVCAIFKLLEHSTFVHNSLGLEISHGLTCYFGSDAGWTISIHKNNTESEFSKTSWLNQREFLWLLYIPRVSILDKLKPCILVKALFISESQDLMVQKGGHALVYQENVEEFVRMIIHCSSTFPNNSQPGHQFAADDNRNNKQNYDDQGETSVTRSSSDRLRGPIYRGESSTTANQPHISDKQITNSTNFLLKHFEDFNELYIYDRCFPPGEIPELFSHHSAGSSVTIELSSNFDDAHDIVGLVVCASFSVQEYPIEFLDNLESQVPDGLACLLDTHRFRKPHHVYCPTKEEFKWILHLRGFNWLFYIPFWWLFDRIFRCNRITASMASKWPGWMVQKCALRVVHLQDAQEMFQILHHLSVSFFDNWGLFHKDIVLEEDCIPMETFSTQIEECNSMDSGSASNACPTSAENQGSKSDSTILHKRNFKSLLLRIFEGFDPFSVSNTCFPDTKIPEWFGHHGRGTIQLPPDFYNDSNWMGLALCTAFSVHEHTTVSQDNLDSNVTNYHLICQLDTDIGSLDPPHVFRITEEKFMGFYPHGFIWLSYIPCWSVRDLVGQCGQIEASVVSDCPSLMVQDCSLRLLYHQDMEEFEHSILKCLTSPFANMDLILQSIAADTINNTQNKDACVSYEGQRSGSGVSFKGQQHKSDHLLDFDRCSVYNSCFPHCEILEWFNHRSNEPSVTFKLPPNFYNDSNWIGLALCASFSVDKDSAAIHENLDLETSCHLICHLETDIGSVEPLHVYCLTKEDLKLFHLGIFTWLSYTPRGSIPEWLNQCTRIEASIASDSPSLTVQKCGFRLLYLHDEVELKQTIRHCVASFSDQLNSSVEV